MKNTIFALVVLTILAGCDGSQDSPRVSLLCDGNDAYGITADGDVGPWVMTKSGPVIGDRAGKVTGTPIPCGEVEKLLNVEAKSWPSIGVKASTIEAEKCLPDTKPGCVGIDLEALSKATYSTFHPTPVRIAGDLMVCPLGHSATGDGLEKSGCESSDPISIEDFADSVCPGGRVLGVTPELSQTEPKGVVGLTVSIKPASGAHCSSVE